MKKLTILMLTSLLMLTAAPVFANGSNTPRTPSPKELTEVNVLITRLGEIEKLDKSKLDRSAKRELRKEVKEIQKELKSLNSGGIYLSVGALILIAVLLILFL